MDISRYIYRFQLDSLNPGLTLKTHIEHLSIDVKQCLAGDGWSIVGMFGDDRVEHGGAHFFQMSEELTSKKKQMS